jgi:hypothetical protein
MPVVECNRLDVPGALPTMGDNFTNLAVRFARVFVGILNAVHVVIFSVAYRHCQLVSQPCADGVGGRWVGAARVAREVLGSQA